MARRPDAVRARRPRAGAAVPIDGGARHAGARGAHLAVGAVGVPPARPGGGVAWPVCAPASPSHRRLRRASAQARRDTRRVAVLQRVAVGGWSLYFCEDIVLDAILDRLCDRAKALHGAHILHVNATAYGGGVSELLRSSVPLLRDLGLVEYRAGGPRPRCPSGFSTYCARGPRLMAAPATRPNFA